MARHGYSSPPATLGSTAAAQVRVIVWCKDCQHRIEPDPAELVRRYGAETSIPDWHKRLVCSKCGSRAVDFVLSGGEGVGGHDLTARAVRSSAARLSSSTLLGKPLP